MKKRLRQHFEIILLRTVFSIKKLKYKFSLQKSEKKKRKNMVGERKNMWKMCHNKTIMQVRTIAVCFMQTEENMQD